MAIRVTEAKKGMVVRYENDLYQITRYDHLTPGNLRAIHHVYLKNLKNGRQKEVRMKTSDTLDLVYLDSRESQYLCFMAGATSIFFGDKLLTTGNPDVEEDLGMLRAAGLRALVPADAEKQASSTTLPPVSSHAPAAE